MNIISLETNPPKKYTDTIIKETDRAKALNKATNLNLSEKKRETIIKALCEKYETWRRQTKAMRQRLVELNDLLEGVVHETNFPFEDASNITIGYAGGLARTFRATFNNTAYKDPDIFAARTKNPEVPKEEIDKIEEAVNYAFHSETNGLDILRLGTVPCFRDGTLIISGFWKREIEKCNDTKVYSNASEFLNDFPSAIEAGISDEEFEGLMDNFIVDPETEVLAKFQYDTVVNNGPKFEIIPLARFVYYPQYSETIKDMEMYGREYYLQEAKIREYSNTGEFYKKEADKLLLKNRDSQVDTWSRAKNFIEGISNSDDKQHPFKLVDCVIKIDLDNDGVREKYVVTFCPEYKIILSFQNYFIRKNIDFCVDFRFIKREDRFLGTSLCADGQDKFELLDTIHRHRNNIRSLVTSPVLLANKQMKEDLDFLRPENLIKPGTVFWVNDPNSSVKQLILQNFDQPGNSLDEENLISRYIEFTIGPTQALSGGDNKSDPRAPMGKTIALLQQANQRIDDYMDEFRKSMPELAKLLSALMTQHAAEKITYELEQSGEIKVKEVDRKLFEKTDIIWKAKRRSVTLSPEFAMQRLGGLMQVYAQLLPLIQQKDKIGVELWNRMVVASGEPSKEILMITGDQQADPMAELMNRIGSAQKANAGGGMPPLPQQTMTPSPKSPLTNIQ